MNEADAISVCGLIYFCCAKNVFLEKKGKDQDVFKHASKANYLIFF